MIELENDAETATDAGSSADDYASGYPHKSLRSVLLDRETAPSSKPESHFKGTLGTFILIFGLMLPALAISCTTTINIYSACGVLLRHWVESLVQFSLLLSIPFGLAFAWTRVKKGDLRRARLVGHVIGVSAGAALLTAIVTSAAGMMVYPTFDSSGLDHSAEMLTLAFVSWGAFLASVCVGFKFRELWPTNGAKWSSTAYMLIGAGLSVLLLGASEARSACIRIAERLVISGTDDQKQHGLDFLRNAGADCERSLRVDCSTNRAMDISGMFLNLSNEDFKKLYFLTTGGPFRLDLKNPTDFASLPDELLGKQVIGDKVSNLSMHRSLISGTIHPESLTSTLDWTFVFKNTGFDAKEARAEIALPKDAVVSEMVLWINGLPKRATIASSETATQAYQWVVGGRKDPALVTDLGKGRVLVQCYPVASQSEVRVKISMKSSMKLDKAGEAIVSLPSISKSNFEVEGQHRVHLRADRELMLDLDNVRQVVANNGLHQVTGTLSSAKRSKETIDVRVARDVFLKPVAIKDPIDNRGYIIQQYVPTVSKRPDHLVVVVDGSEALQAHKDEIARKLSKIPATIPTSLIVASDKYKEGMQFESLKDAIAAMKQIEFKGGQENLGAVIQGAELAGETEGGAVLWIHGPQPALDKELYIIAPYLVKPSFYQLSIDDNVTDVNEFFKAHQEIGPFTAVARNSSFESDLGRFLNKWQADGVDYTLKYARTFETPAKLETSVYVQDEITRLYVAQKVRELVDHGRRWEAANLAVRYQVVTPVTSAVVLENSSDYARFGLREAQSADGSDSVLALNNNVDRRGRRNAGEFQRAEQPRAIASNSFGGSFGDAFSNQSANNTGAQTEMAMAGTAPILQGATNGTIGPQGGDAASIMGVNTAGAVRVNNLANLEALLNLLANGAEIGGVATGGVMLLLALFRGGGYFPGTSIGLSRKQRLVLGVLLILAGLSTPGLMNTMVASARDANLFS